MSLTSKLIIALICSVLINVGLLFVVFAPTPTPSTTADKILAQKNKEIQQYKKLIIERDIRIEKNRQIQDSLQSAINRNKVQLKKDNEDVYKIPDSNLNDTVHSILEGL